MFGLPQQLDGVQSAVSGMGAAVAHVAAAAVVAGGLGVGATIGGKAAGGKHPANHFLRSVVFPLVVRRRGTICLHF